LVRKPDSETAWRWVRWQTRDNYIAEGLCLTINYGVRALLAAFWAVDLENEGEEHDP